MSKPGRIAEKPLQEYSRLTDEQLAAVKKLVKKCCNFLQGTCVALDKGDGCPCVQSFSYSLICKWFRNAVLPLDPSLEAALWRGDKKQCAYCGNYFIPRSNRALYCPNCRTIHQREADAAKHRRLYAQKTDSPKRTKKRKAREYE